MKKQLFALIILAFFGGFNFTLAGEKFDPEAFKNAIHENTDLAVQTAALETDVSLETVLVLINEEFEIAAEDSVAFTEIFNKARAPKVETAAELSPTVTPPTAVAAASGSPNTDEARFTLREKLKTQFGTVEQVQSPPEETPTIQWAVGNNGEIHIPVFLNRNNAWSILTGDLVNGVKTPPTATVAPTPGRRWQIIDRVENAVILTAPDGRTIPTEGAIKDGAIVFGTVH